MRIPNARRAVSIKGAVTFHTMRVALCTGEGTIGWEVVIFALTASA
jgi:hypothetical protein